MYRTGESAEVKIGLLCFWLFKQLGKERANVIFRSFNQLAKEHQISTQRVATFVRVRTPYETRLQIIYFLFGIAKSDGHISQETVVLRVLLTLSWLIATATLLVQLVSLTLTRSC